MESFEIAWTLEPTYEMLKALAGDPLLLAGSDEQELRRRYKTMRERAPRYVSQSKALEQALELLTACSQCDIQYDAKDWMRRELAAEYGVDVDDRDSSVADVVDAFLKLHPILNREESR